MLVIGFHYLNTLHVPSDRDVDIVQFCMEFRIVFRASKFLGADNVITSIKMPEFSVSSSL